MENLNLISMGAVRSRTSNFLGIKRTFKFLRETAWNPIQHPSLFSENSIRSTTKDRDSLVWDEVNAERSVS